MTVRMSEREAWRSHERDEGERRRSRGCNYALLRASYSVSDRGVLLHVACAVSKSLQLSSSSHCMRRACMNHGRS